MNEPAIYVMGERQGQKVFPGAGGPGQMPMTPGGDRPGMNYPGMPPMGMPRNAQGMLAHQNSQMEALERRAQRERGMSMAQVRRPLLMLGPCVDVPSSVKAGVLWTTMTRQVRYPTHICSCSVTHRRIRIDESESISARTLALTRYRRNHEFMNEVFMYAAFGTHIVIFTIRRLL